MACKIPIRWLPENRYAQMEQSGIDVIAGVLEKELRWLNRSFITSMEKQRPRFILKAGMSLDGKIALPDGRSQWISGPVALTYGGALRAQVDAILVGRRTLERDNPKLSCRTSKVHPLTRLVIDETGNTIKQEYGYY